MCLAVTQQRERVAGVVKELKENSVDASLSAAIDAWFDAYNDGDKTMEVSENLVKALEAAELTGEQADRKADILNNKEHLSKKSMWMYGGDGWAYDIGFGGLDHVLASGTDVNILVVDTEVYSNTGGQASKATQIGAVAQFAASGKKTKKKAGKGIKRSRRIQGSVPDHRLCSMYQPRSCKGHGMRTAGSKRSSSSRLLEPVPL